MCSVPHFTVSICLTVRFGLRKAADRGWPRVNYSRCCIAEHCSRRVELVFGRNHIGRIDRMLTVRFLESTVDLR